ncbi:MAG: rod shape-determining protein MreC [Syntrophomonadaceae bacterium]|nr:rod shape-determining protein MreC [Syntrophomonadaceae bacterium]
MRNFIKNKYFWLVLIVFIGTFWLINNTSSERHNISVLEKMIRDAYTPLQSGVVEFKENLGQVNAFFASKQEMHQEIGRLQEENQRLIMENQVLREDKMELRRLRSLLGFRDISLDKYQMVGARVIARSPNNWYRNIVIDKGTDSGIRKGMAVISPHGLVGRVASVSRESAHVDLIIHREIAVGAIVQENRETQGIVEGLGISQNLRMVNIPYYSTIKEGYHIITSGLSESYPKGINIGRVKEVELQPDGILLSALVEPSVDFDKLEEVLVIVNYKLSNDEPIPE